MKKIGILTHYNVVNNGAVLQMYCLYNFLLSKGFDPVIFTYEKNFDFAPDVSKKYKFKFSNIGFFIKQYLFKYSLGVFLSKIKKTRIFNKFSKKVFKFEKYTSKCNAAIIGSDEVFSLEVGCNRMMYGHGINSNIVVTYAPSFGQTTIERIKEHGCDDIITNGLKNKVSCLSVRDKNSFDICKSLTGRNDIVKVCDPVILYNLVNTHSKITKPKHKFILLYSYFKNMNDEREISIIKEFAKKKGFKVISVGEYHRWCDKSIICNPLEWLEYFRLAEMVITDTFHGAVLSIINLKKAVIISRNINSNKLGDLVDRFRLNSNFSNHISEDLIDKVWNNEIDKVKIQSIIDEERKNGESYLLSSLKDA